MPLRIGVRRTHTSSGWKTNELLRKINDAVAESLKSARNSKNSGSCGRRDQWIPYENRVFFEVALNSLGRSKKSVVPGGRTNDIIKQISGFLENSLDACRKSEKSASSGRKNSCARRNFRISLKSHSMRNEIKKYISSWRKNQCVPYGSRQFLRTVVEVGNEIKESQEVRSDKNIVSRNRCCILAYHLEMKTIHECRGKTKL